MIKELNKLLTCLTVVNEAKRSTGQSIEDMMSVVSGKRLSLKILYLALSVAFATCALCQDASTLRPPKIFYISKSGSDSNTGTAPDNAFLKIQTGIDHLEVPGDSLRIFPGTYTEFVTVQGKAGSSDIPIVIEGLPGISRESAVIIQGPTRLLEAIVAKNKDGSPGDAALYFDGAFQRIVDWVPEPKQQQQPDPADDVP
jgi:hypothetical protein